VLTVDVPEAVRDDARIDRARLAAFLRAEIPGLAGEMELLQFHAGHSNLTYLVRFGARELVLKRAPLGAHAASAHDMGREFKVLSRLHGAYPYAPKALAHGDDPALAGSAFCVMERSRGIIVRGPYPPDVPGERIARQLNALVDGLVELHAIDPAAVGLGDFGRPLGYRGRQIAGWAKRLEASRTDDMPDFAPLLAWLEAHAPREAEIPAVVHNDFKLDNLVWAPDDLAQLQTVLDWEMSTVGEGALDLACTLSFWVQQDDPDDFRALRAMPTGRPGAPRRRDVAQRYAARTGRDLPSFDFLLAFGYFRRAAIEQQKRARFLRGDTTDARFADLGGAVRTLHAMCERAITGELSA
jgi:aminoglycoside phosphotransferase (APT) family kinase protein